MVKKIDEIVKELSKPLDIDDVELRVGANSKKSFTLLLYKTARTDRNRLDSVCPMWSNEHTLDANNNVRCTISIWDYETKQWVARQDVGTESNTEKEKGAYSDSFKRAGTRWGIGTELYNTDSIRINWEMQIDEYATKRAGKDKYKPKDFWDSELSISKYKVFNGKPQLEILYKDKVVYSNFKITPHDEDGAYQQALDNIKALGDKNAVEEYRLTKLPVAKKYFEKRNCSEYYDKLETALEEVAAEYF